MSKVWIYPKVIQNFLPQQIVLLLLCLITKPTQKLLWLNCNKTFCLHFLFSFKTSIKKSLNENYSNDQFSFFPLRYSLGLKISRIETTFLYNNKLKKNKIKWNLFGKALNLIRLIDTFGPFGYIRVMDLLLLRIFAKMLNESFESCQTCLWILHQFQ